MLVSSHAVLNITQNLFHAVERPFNGLAGFLAVHLAEGYSGGEAIFVDTLDAVCRFNIREQPAVIGLLQFIDRLHDSCIRFMKPEVFLSLPAECIPDDFGIRNILVGIVGCPIEGKGKLYNIGFLDSRQ